MSELEELKAEWFEFGRKAGLQEAHRYQHQCNADLETQARLIREGREFEQERIIKLLGIWDCNNDRCDCDSINECVYRQELIALIKGEK
jgi:hypothetical protein